MSDNSAIEWTTRSFMPSSFTTRGLPGGAVEITHVACQAVALLSPESVSATGDLLTLGNQMRWAAEHECVRERAPEPPGRGAA